ncbi:RDD family protein [Xylanimonas sp. McL0601]|uniref:RDD family protein n=1 Tax=Xylanimonas sp. McL0601 TaxID=3414739 RepID=UPI003CF41773
MTSIAAVTPPPAPPWDAASEPVASPPQVAYASWRRRVVATLLDDGLLGGLTWLALGDGVDAPSLAPVFSSNAAPDAASWWHSLWVVGGFVVLLGLQSDTGWTPGKLVAGIAVVRERDLRPAGFLRNLARVGAHLLDAILMIGYLRPLWEPKRRTFADTMLETVVVRRRPERLARGWEFALTAAALVLCLVGAGLQTSWSGWSKDVVSGHQVCTAVAAGDGAAAVARSAFVGLDGRETQGVERRLWISHPVRTARSYTATWHWDETLTATGDLAIETTVTGTGGGAVTGRVGIAGRSSEVTTVEATQSGSGPVLTTASSSVGGEQTPALGDTVDVATSFLVDGQPVATCSVAGFTLDQRVP